MLMPTDGPYFHNAESAVRFAVNREGAPVQVMASMVSEGAMSVGGRNWTRFDALTQAGFILGIVRRLGNAKSATMIAKTAVPYHVCSCRSDCCSGRKINWDWRNAVETLAYEAKGVEAIPQMPHELRSLLLVKIYGRTHLHLSRVAKQFEQFELDTISLYHRSLNRWLYGAKQVEGLEVLAWREADQALRDAGIVGET